MLDVDTITTIQSIVHFITDVVLCFFFTFILNWLVFQKRERKLKRKRCLAMANWCYTNVHCISWLELAEKFKPNNSTAQQGKGKQNG